MPVIDLDSWIIILVLFVSNPYFGMKIPSSLGKYIQSNTTKYTAALDYFTEIAIVK